MAGNLWPSIKEKTEITVNKVAAYFKPKQLRRIVAL